MPCLVVDVEVDSLPHPGPARARLAGVLADVEVGRLANVERGDVGKATVICRTQETGLVLGRVQFLKACYSIHLGIFYEVNELISFEESRFTITKFEELTQHYTGQEEKKLPLTRQLRKVGQFLCQRIASHFLAHCSCCSVDFGG